MLNHQNLTQEQQILYFQLKKAISSRRSISNILEAASKNDLLKVLTIRYTTRFSRGGRYTLTLLGLAIYKNDNECVNSILTHSQNNDILQEILKTSSTINYIISGYMYTLTPLTFAIYRGNNECINSILIRAQNSGMLQNILASKDVVQFSGLTYIITPLSFAIYKGNNECINSILIRARNSGILQEVFLAVSTVLSPYVEYTLNAFKLSVVIHQNGANVRTALDNVSISHRLQENSRT